MKMRVLLTAVLLAGPLHAAHAGEQYVDGSGYAAGGYDVVAFHEMSQTPVDEPQPEAVPGKTSITAEYNGATWAFASEENKRRFVADPEKYAPRFDGHCALGVAKGAKVPGNPNLWRIVDGELYFNVTPGAAEQWQADIPGYLDAAEDNWQSLETAAAASEKWKAYPSNKDTYSTDAPLNN